jgi:hypothetical protein
VVNNVCPNVVVDLVEDAVITIERGQATTQVAPLLPKMQVTTFSWQHTCTCSPHPFTTTPTFNPTTSSKHTYTPTTFPQHTYTPNYPSSSSYRTKAPATLLVRA